MSETKVSELWDEAIETGLKRIGYGILAGSGSALVLARKDLSLSLVLWSMETLLV